MLLLKILISIFSIIIIGFILLLLGLSFRAKQSPQQLEFLSGTIPAELPDGFYQGSVNFPQHIWQGKTFNRAGKTGINTLQINGKTSEGFPFKTTVGAGNVDPQLQTLKIDYNVPQNQPIVRLVVDEVVETAPNHYLGKLELRILPNMTLALGYFKLDKK